MKLSPVLALMFVCAPVTAPIAANAQTAVPTLQTLPMAPKVAETSDSWVWRFTPPVGSRWTMRSFVRATSLTQTPAIGGEKGETSKTVSMQKMTADYDIISRDALGATTIRMTVREMTGDADTTIDGEKVTLMSPTKADSKAAGGATLTIKHAPDGTIWGVVGTRAFQRKILQASGVRDEKVLSKTLDAVAMENTALLKSFGMDAGMLPVSPVRLGESWNYKFSVPVQGPFALDMNGTRTIKSLDSQVAVIGERASLSSDAQKKLLAVPDADGIRVDYSQLSGTMSGITRVQRSSGLPLEATANMVLKGNISTVIPAMDGEKAQTVTIPLEVTTSTRIVLEPR